MIDIDAAIQAALKNKEPVALTAYRAVKAKTALKLSEAGREPGKALSEEEQLAIIRKEIKERAEANEYRDRADPEHAFDQGVIATLEKHLPRQPSRAESDALIDQVIGEVRPSGPKEMGKVMAALRQAHAGLDMAYASARVKEILSKLG